MQKVWWFLSRFVRRREVKMLYQKEKNKKKSFSKIFAKLFQR